MSKFCGKCGSKLDETTGLCLICNKNSDSHNISETDKSDSHINTDIDAAVTSNPEYAEEKTTDILENAVVSKFCKKCGTKMDADTGLCPMCNKTVDLHNISETDKSDSHINTDIDTAVTSKPEYAEEKATDISENAVVSKFCKKCGSKINVNTGLCPKCDAVQNFYEEHDYSDEEFEESNDYNSDNEDNLDAPVYQDDFYEENHDGSEIDTKMSTSSKITISVIVITIILIIAFALLDLFGVIGTGIFKSFGIDPINSEITSTESTEVSSYVIETTICETTVESTATETTVPNTTRVSSTIQESQSELKPTNNSIPLNEENKSKTNDENLNQDNIVGWKKLYIDCINNSESEYESGKIIYIDNNNIPELYMVNKNSDGLDILYWIDDNDNLNFMEIRHLGLLYYEYGGLLLDHSFDTTYGGLDIVNKFNNGSMDWWHMGSYVPYGENNSNSGYCYFWDNNEVSEEEYNAELDNVFNINYAKKAFDNTYYKDDIISIIRNM